MASLFKQVPNIRTLLRQNFFSGLMVVIPLSVIAWLLGAILKTLWGFNRFLPEGLRPENFFSDPELVILFKLAVAAGATVLLALGISFMGWASKQYLGQKTLELVGDIIQRIPIIRSVYSGIDQMLRAFASGGGHQFSRVVYLEYPRKGCWAIAFVTGPAREPAIPPNHVNVYVPTTPNPTSGFHLIVPESEVRDSQMRVEDAFKTILSLGIAQPLSTAQFTDTGALTSGDSGGSPSHERH